MADRSGYIGRAPGDSSVTVARQTFSPTGVTTDFTFASGYTVGYLDLFLNGAKLIEGVDYNATDASTISLVSAAINGDVLEGVAYKAFNLGDANRIGIQSTGTLIGNVNTLNFIGVGNTFALNGSTIDVSISAGAGGTWSNYDTNTGVTTSKKVKISNNLEVTGVTTSTGGFVGALTGNATGLSGTPDIAVRNITGVAATFTGVLTYEDVTNIDSIGIITARSDVSIADKIVHTGDTNTAIRFPAADTFTVETGGSERLRITSGGEVVVNGTATGSNAKFEVQSTTGSISSATLRVSAEKTTTGAINTGSTILLAGHDGGNSRDFGSIFAGKENGTGSNYAAYLAFGTRANGSTMAERLRIDSSGRLLVGTSSALTTDSGCLFQLATSAAGNICLGRNDTTTVSGENLGAIRWYGNDSSGTYEMGASIEAVADLDHATGDKPTRLVFSTTADGASSPTERLRIHSHGQLELKVPDANPALKITPSGTNATAAIDFNTPGTGVAKLLVQGTERLRITSAGKVGINETTPQNQLHVHEDTSYHGIFVNGNGAPRINFARSTTTTAEWSVGVDGTDGAKFCIAQAGNTAKITLDTSGNFTAVGNVTAYSDISLKENIETIPNALDKVLNLRGVEFDRIDKEDNTHEIGVIAQEVEEVIPEVVLTNTEGIKSVAYGNLVGLLIESIKELKAEVNDLKAQVEG